MQAKSWQVSELMARLQPDPWRREIAFSPEMADCHKILFAPDSSRDDMANALAEWLSQFQPCLFGRMEAKQRRLAFCVLTENDLERSDQEIRARIETERASWKYYARQGDSHGFLIVAVSPIIAQARPGPALLQLAACLCKLYLGVATQDEIHHDDLTLEIRRAHEPIELRHWKVGVNYFSAQGDGRWWRDHRIPGGMALSMNSVGHMARSRVESALIRNPELARQFAELPRERLVYWALPTAMKTIGPRERSRGTWLVPRGEFPEDKDPPTFETQRRHFRELAGYSENRYRGLYHTDVTIPSEYFDEGLWKLEDIGERDNLFFTYLHSLADDDYRCMGIGEEILAEENAGMNEDNVGNKP